MASTPEGTRLTDRLHRLPLPEGTISVGTGLVLAGLAQYGFLVVAARALGPVRYTPLATFWALLFVCGPGFFIPLEQETGRAIAARRVRGEGGLPLIVRAGTIGSILALALVVAALAAGVPIVQRVFNGDSVLLVALAAGFVAFLCQFLARGTLAGNGRFGAYGVLIGGEGVLRVVFAVALALIGITSAGPFGLAMVAASFAAVAIALAGRRGLFRSGPPAPWSEVSTALGYLLVASVVTQFLLSIGTVVVQLLATPAQQAAAGRFQLSRIVAYVPIFLFQAVQAALLPKLSALATAGRHREFRRVLNQLLAMTAGLGAVAIVAFTVLGPPVTRLLFGGGFELNNLDFALLSASCIGFIATQVFSQALISLAGYRRVAAGWLTGGVAFVLVTALGSQLFLRVELGLLCGAIASTAVMSLLLFPLLRSRATLDTEPRIARARPA